MYLSQKNDIGGHFMFKNNFSRILGERLISVTQVSEETGISRSTLTSLYYKKTMSVRLDTLLKICDVLGVELIELITYIPSVKYDPNKD